MAIATFEEIRHKKIVPSFKELRGGVPGFEKIRTSVEPTAEDLEKYKRMGVKQYRSPAGKLYDFTKPEHRGPVFTTTPRDIRPPEQGIEAKTLPQAAKHGYRRGGVMMVKQLAGLSKMAGEFIEPGAKAKERAVFPALTRFWERQSDKMKGWSDFMLKGVEEYYDAHPEEAIQIAPNLGYLKTLNEYITKPQNLLQGLVESAPLMLEGVLGNVAGGMYLGIAAMGTPITGEVYADARKEGTEPLTAMAQAVLTGAGEATIEQWTLGRKLGLLRNFRKMVAGGLPKVLWEGTKAFFRGTAEEGTQEFNRNFWQWIFTDRSQPWLANVTESMAAGGPMEMVMAGAFTAAGSVGPMVSNDQKLQRVEKIRTAIDQSPNFSKAHKAEIDKELDKVAKDVEKGEYAELEARQAAEVATMDAELAAIQRQPPTVAKITPERPTEAITPTKPTVAKAEQIVIKLKNGQIISGPLDEFTSHSDLAVKKGVDFEQIESSGFIDNKGRLKLDQDVGVIGGKIYTVPKPEAVDEIPPKPTVTPKAEGKVELKAKEERKLKVIRQVRDADGKSLGYLVADFDGTPEDAISKAKILTNQMYEKYPEASNIQSQIAATDAKGKAKFTISQNFKIVEDIAPAPTPAKPTVTPKAAPVAEGKVIKAYHGTPVEGKFEFDIEQVSPTDIRGIYFTPDKEYAETFVEKDTAGKPFGQVGEYSLTVRNPADEKIVAEIEKKIRDDVPELELGYWTTVELQKRGYDAVIRDAGNEIIVFDKSQISAARPTPSALERKPAKLPQGYRIQKIAGKYDIYRPDDELAGTRPTEEAAIKYAQVYEKEFKMSPKAKPAKEPWEIEEGEWIKIVQKERQFTPAPGSHEAYVEEAVEQGKPVPREVLEEYKSEKWAQEALAKPEAAAKEVEEEIDETGGISKRRRNRLIKQAEQEIEQTDLYQTLRSGLDDREIGIGYYYIPEKFRSEVEDIIGKKRTKLRQMFTFKLSDRKFITLPTGEKAEIGPTDWTMAVQEQLGRGKEGIAETEAHLDISDFVQRVKDAFDAGRTFGRLNTEAVEAVRESGDPWLQYKIGKLEMLHAGYSAQEIDDMTAEFAKDNDIPLEVFDNEWVGPEAKKLKEIKQIKDEAEQDKAIEALAKENVLRKQRDEADQAVKEVLKANKLEAEVRKVEEIEEDDIPFERRGPRPTGATITRASEQIVLLAYGADSATGYHEGYHVLRRRLTSKDIKVLDKHFKGDEEAEATAFAEFARTGRAARSYLKGIWRKLVELLRKIKSELQGRGFRTVNDIFGEIQVGRIAQAGLRLGAVRYEKGLSYNKILKRQRELEGVMAAVRDPKTGKVYTAHTHKAAIEKAPRGGGVWGRLSDEWDKGTDNTGYVDKNGKFISRTEAEKRWNVLTIEDVEDVKEGRIQYERGVFGQPIERQLRLPFPERQAAIKRAVIAEKARPGKKIAGKPYEYWRPRGRVKIKAKLIKEVDKLIGASMKPKDTSIYITPEGIATKLGGLFGDRSLFYDAPIEPQVQEAFAQLVKGGPLFDIRYETTTERLIRETIRRAQVKAEKARLKARVKPKKARKGRIKINIRDVTPVLREDLKPLEVPPPAEPPRGGRKPPYFSDAWYKENIKKQRRYWLGRLSSAGRRIFLTGEKILTSSSTRLYNIHPELFRQTRRYIYDVLNRTAVMVDAIDPFLKGAKRMKATDRKQLDLALKNSDSRKITEMVVKYKLQKEYGQARDVLDEIYDTAKEVGIDIEYQREYWHRHIKDPQGFLEYFQGREDWSIIEQAIKRRAERAGRKIEDLTDDEKAQVVNTLLRGFRTQALILARPGAAKERTVDVVWSEIDQFYDDFGTAIMKYIKLMNAKIAEREFFGRETKEIQNLRKLQSSRLTRLIKLKRREGLRPGTTMPEHKEHISKTMEAWKAGNERLERLTNRSPSDTIGGYVYDLVRQGQISPTQEKQVQDVLRGIFAPKGMGWGMGLFSTGIYIDTLNSPIQALTQLDEFAYSFYRSPLRSIPVVIRTAFRKSKIEPRDIGIRTIGMEFQGPSMKRALTLLLKSTGFELVDRLNKENYINTVLSKYQAQARSRKESPALVKRLARVFGKDHKEVLEDLRRPIKSLDDVSDNVKYLLFNEILDIQPIAITEMPEAYNKAGGLRILYTLKTFYIKRFDFLRNEAFKDMKSPKTFLRGFSKLVWLSFAFALFGAVSDFLKDWVKGRAFDLWDSFVDNMLRMVMSSKFQVTQAQKEGLGRAALEQLVPPTKVIDEISKDVVTIAKGKDRGFEIWRSVPVVGELYYWWFGRGREKIEKKAEETWVE